MARIAVLQMTSGVDPARNAQAIVAAVEAAAAGGATMLFTPEMSGLLDRDRARAAAHIVTEAQDPVLPVRALMTANATIRFLLVYNFAPHRVEAAISDITEALKEGRIQPLPTTILPLESVAEAHAMVERGIFGRVLLDVRG